MKICTQSFVDNLTSKNLRFQAEERDNKDVVRLRFQNSEIIVVFAGDKGEYAQLMTLIASASDSKFVDLVLVCNQINTEYRFLKFTVDSDNDVMARSDAILDPSSAGDECFELLVRFLQILDDCRPAIMKAIYC